MLEKKGWKVLMAPSAKQARNQLESLNIQVVILGVELPDMDALTALKSIKQLSPLTQVIMAAEQDTLNCIAKALTFGAMDYLITPTDLGDLVTKTENAFAKRQQLEEKVRASQINVLRHQFGCRK